MNNNLARNLSHMTDSLSASRTHNLSKVTKDNPEFIRRLVNYKSLPVHNGCVNSIVWNQNGNYILSGSDDRKLVIAEPFHHSYKVKVEYKTTHLSNIFCARFLPLTNDEKIISCSGDGVILVTDLQHTESYINRYECHDSTCYKLLPLDSFTFLSCSEDKTVRFYDIRVKQSCCCRVSGSGGGRRSFGPGSSSPSLHQTKQIIKAPRPVSAMSSHPLKPYEVALGVADASIYIHDRRMLDTSFQNTNVTECIERLRIPNLEDKQYRVTSVNYSANGNELLASISSDYIYLFQMAKDLEVGAESVRKFQKTESVSSSLNRSQPSYVNKSHPTHAGAVPSTNSKKTKKLRLRGDWSDTGPDARPSTEGGSLGEIGQARPTLHSSLMERMTIVLGQMLNSVNNAAPASALEQIGIENDQLNDLIDHNLQLSSPSENGLGSAAGGGPSSSPSNAALRYLRNRSGATSMERSSNLESRQIECRGDSGVPLHEQEEKERKNEKLYQKYEGHRNTRTMIKETSFWGENYIVSGSDCGHIFFWNKLTGEIVGVLQGDKHVVNNVQPHPFYPVLASSGIDYDVKLWSPSSSESIYDPAKIQELIRRNELMLEETKDTITVPATFMIRMLSCLSHIRHQNNSDNISNDEDQDQAQDDHHEVPRAAAAPDNFARISPFRSSSLPPPPPPPPQPEDQGQDDQDL